MDREHSSVDVHAFSTRLASLVAQARDRSASLQLHARSRITVLPVAVCSDVPESLVYELLAALSQMKSLLPTSPAPDAVSVLSVTVRFFTRDCIRSSYSL